MDIEESARRLGAIAWIESTLFGVLGAAAPRCPTPAVKVMVATHSRHAAWRAEQLRDRLPEVGPFAADVVSGPPAGGDRLLAHLSGLDELPLMVDVYRVVVPRLVAATRTALERCDGPADGAAARTLRIVLADQLGDWADAQAVIGALVADASTVARAASAASEAESIWLETGLDGGIPRP